MRSFSTVTVRPQPTPQKLQMVFTCRATAVTSAASPWDRADAARLPVSPRSRRDHEPLTRNAPAQSALPVPLTGPPYHIFSLLARMEEQGVGTDGRFHDRHRRRFDAVVGADPVPVEMAGPRAAEGPVGYRTGRDCRPGRGGGPAEARVAAMGC